MTPRQTTLRLGVFVLLAVASVQCQTGNATPPASNNKPAVKQPPASKGAAVVPAPAPSASPAVETPKPDSAKPTPLRLDDARLDAVAADYASMALTQCLPGTPDPKIIVCNKAYTVQVNDPALRAKLKLYNVGDRLQVDLNEVNGKDELHDIIGPHRSEHVSKSKRLLVLLACALSIFGFAALVMRASPLKFIVGMDNRYSNSKFQIALWFWVALSTYLATVVFRLWFAGWYFFGAVSIPQHLLEISGMSAITYGGAKAITTAKVDAAANPVPAFAGAPLAAPINDPKNARQPGQQRFFQDLLQNDYGHFDFGDFQMLLVTFVAVGMYVTLIFHFLGSIEFLKTATLPDVDSTILASVGIGHGAYLAKKAGGDPGTS